MIGFIEHEIQKHVKNNFLDA